MELVNQKSAPIIDNSPDLTPKEEFDYFTRFLHAGLAVGGTLAWVTGELAGDYKKASHLGFTVHSWLGITVSLFLLLRIMYGFWGPSNVRFADWCPCTRERLLAAWEDVQTLLRLQLPQRASHDGLKGLIQGFGLLVFSWQALTGSLLFNYLQPGAKARGVIHFIKEIHEIGNWLIPIFLGLHLTGTLLDAIWGEQKWRRMFFLQE
ncbi:MAG: cytochrome b/b6 domain-containing protein [Deltaproteobacteria bacterium]|nr:cytochrome b/b6 domain-containing protein [Deltaproteobacteria bacterium]